MCFQITINTNHIIQHNYESAYQFIISSYTSKGTNLQESPHPHKLSHITPDLSNDHK